ncbi:MAG: tripartite tricarboxylate transporter substrate binding protein [Burkholderiales bacterium]
MRQAIWLITILHFTMAATVCVAADAYPQRPLRFIVPFPPGGANDIVARLLGPKLTERLGQQIVVDNRPGASGTIALELTARAQPDGYTFIVGNNTSNSIVPVLFAERMKFDPVKELTGISLLAAIPHVVIAAAKFPPNTFQELIAYAKARPGQLNYNAPLGGHPHLDMLALLAATGTSMVHIPSKGAGETIPSLLRGEAQVSNSNVATVIGLIRAGQLKAYAVTSENRMPELPNVPTFVEVGLKGVGSINWVGLFAPTKTPPAIITKLHATIVEILSQPELKDTYAKRLVPLAISASPAEFNAFVASETKRWVKIVKDNGVRLE